MGFRSVDLRWARVGSCRKACLHEATTIDFNFPAERSATMGPVLYGSFVCFSLLASAAAVTTTISSGAAAPTDSAPLVRVSFYMEALCPYCSNFTKYHILPLWQSGILDLADLEIIPWGNARYHPSSDSIECQHGANECELNAVLSCALHLYTARSEWLPFVGCMEELAFKDRDTEHVVGHCAHSAGLDADSILSCSSGHLGRELQIAAWRRTSALRPAHEYVPWLVVNDIPLQDDDESIAKFICAGYTGVRPDACYELGVAAAKRQAGHQASDVLVIKPHMVTMRQEATV